MACHGVALRPSQAWGFLYACCPKFQCCFRTLLRGKLRKRAAIEGSPRDDCLISCFLPACALCQEEHEYDAIKHLLAQQPAQYPTVQASAVVAPREPVVANAVVVTVPTPGAGGLQASLLKA